MDGQREPCPLDCDRSNCRWWIATDAGIRREIEGEPTAEEHGYVYDCAVPIIAHSALELVRLLAETVGMLRSLLRERPSAE